MAVYVDEPRWQWRGMVWGHLTADTLIELHDFADRLDLMRSWFQYPKSRYPHYDITRSKHLVALKMGAILVDSRVLVKKSIALRPSADIEDLLTGAPTEKGRGSRSKSRH